MATEPLRPKGRNGTLFSLNEAIEAVDLAKEASRITQAKAAFGCVVALLSIIRVGFFLVPIDQPLTDAVYRTR